MKWEAMPMKIAGYQKLALGLLLLVLAGCQTITSEPVVIDKPIVETPQDSALSKLVRDRLHGEKKVDLTNVKVESSSGAVYLSGTVQSLDAREHAIKSAWEVRGVQSVVNYLTVKN
jgi:osmotically-inducible protein OsmY